MRAGNGTKPWGEVATLIMAALADADRHGYAIVAAVREMSNGSVELGTGTLYGALERLLDARCVSAGGDEVVDGRLRRYYHLTDHGRGVLDDELTRAEALAAAARLRLAGGA